MEMILTSNGKIAAASRASGSAFRKTSVQMCSEFSLSLSGSAARTREMNFAETRRKPRIFSQNCKTWIRIFRHRPSEGNKALTALIYFLLHLPVTSTGGRNDGRVPTILDYFLKYLYRPVGTRAETRFRLSAKRTSPFKSAAAAASVQPTTGSGVVHISGSNAGYTMFRGSVESTGYPLHSPVSPFTSPSPCVTVRRHISTGVYQLDTVHQLSAPSPNGTSNESHVSLPVLVVSSQNFTQISSSVNDIIQIKSHMHNTYFQASSYSTPNVFGWIYEKNQQDLVYTSQPLIIMRQSHASKGRLSRESQNFLNRHTHHSSSTFHTQTHFPCRTGSTSQIKMQYCNVRSFGLTSFHDEHNRCKQLRYPTRAHTRGIERCWTAAPPPTPRGIEN